MPVEIFNEIDTPGQILKDSVSVIKRSTFNNKTMTDIVPLKKFSPDHFSKRELNILESLATQYLRSYANDMVEATHLENLPWHQIYEVEGLKQEQIPYELALKKSEYEQVIKNVREHEEFRENYE